MQQVVFLAIITLVGGSPVRLIDGTEQELRCGICQHLTQDLHNILSKQDTQETVENGLRSRCGGLVAEQSDHCKDMVGMLAPSILGLLADNTHPYHMCSSIEMCPAEEIREGSYDPKGHHVQHTEEKENIDMCEFCQFAINVVERFLKKNATLPQINATLFNFCESLPEPLKSECLKFEPAVAKAIADGVDPHEACVKAKVCPAVEPEFLHLKDLTCDACNGIAEVIFGEDASRVCSDIKICEAPTPPKEEKSIIAEPHPAEPEAGPLCDLCELLIQTIDQYIKENKTEAAINATVYKFCNELPEPLKDTCLGFAPELIKVLSEGVDPKTACTKIGLCSEAVQPVKEEMLVPKALEKVVEKTVEAGPLCDLCELLIQTIDQYIKENKTEAAINATVYKFCNELPEPLKDTCLGFAPELIKVLSEGVDPQTACTKIGLCSAEAVQPVKEEMPVPKALEEVVEKTVEAGPLCDLCELLIQTIDQYIKENKTEAAINATVYKFCNELPEPLKDTCLGFAPELIKVLSEGVDPQTACTKIGLCSAEAVQPVKEEMPVPKAWEEVVEKTVEAGPLCDLCELLIQTIDQYIKENKTEAAINATVYKFCNELPEPLKDTCLGFAPELIKVLSEGVDPQTACTKIGLCSAEAVQPVKEERLVPKALEEVVEKTVEAGPLCDLCELLIQTIDQYIKDNKTEAAINATVYKFCNELPEPLKDTCLGFAPELIKVLSEGVDPKTACTKIGLCSEEMHHEVELPRPVEEVVEKAVEAGPLCDLCELLIQTIDQYIKENKTEAAINATVYKFCNELPELLKDTCLGFAPELVKVLSEGVDPQTACTKIGLCSGTSEVEPMELTEESDFEPLVEQEEPKSMVEVSPGCELCQFLIQTVDQYLKQNSSEAFINATLTKFCDDLPEPLRDMCTGFEPELVKILAQGVDPKQACTVIKLCTAEKKETVLPEQPVSPERKEEEVISTPFCDLCELLVKEIDAVLKENSTQAAVNATVYKLCGDLPAPLKTTCFGVASALVQVLTQGTDPKQACTGQVKEKPQPPKEEQRRQVIASRTCELCEFLVHTVDKYLTSKRSLSTIGSTVNKFCESLPNHLSSTCKHFVPQVAKAMVTDGIGPKQACSKLQLCGRNEVPIFQYVTCDVCESSVQKIFPQEFKKICRDTCQDPVIPQSNEIVQIVKAELKDVESAFTCELCKVVVNTIDTMLKNNHSEAAINATIYKICAALPAALQLECRVMAPLLVKELETGFNATKACIDIRACTNTTGEVTVPNETIVRLKRSAVNEFKAVGSVECSMCKGIMEVIDLGIEGGEDKANATLRSVCHRLTPGIDQKCLDFLNQNFAKIWNAIVNGDLAPDKVCKFLKMC